MSQVERRVLELEFDNRNFESGVKQSLDTIDRFNRSLDNLGKSDGFAKVEKSANGFSLKGITNALDGVIQRFTDFGKSASEKISDVEVASGRFSLRSMTSSIDGLGDRFSILRNGAITNLDDIQRSYNSFDLTHMSNALDAFSAKFDALGVAGRRVIENITDSLYSKVTSGISTVVNAVTGRGYQRAMNMENARFTMQGLLGDADKVAELLAAASASVSDTAYGLDQAALATSMFAASGIRDGDKMLSVLSGVAGTAATVNRDYSEIAQIFTRVAGNGRLMAMELNQFATKGLNAAATLTDAFNEVLGGTSNLSEETQAKIREMVANGAENIKDFSGTLEQITEHDLREMVSRGWVDFDTFSEIMSVTFGDHAKDAQKTFTGSLANVKAALARIGENFYAPLIAQETPIVDFFGKLRELINGVNRASKDILPPALTEFIFGLAERGSKWLDLLNTYDVPERLVVPFQSLVDIMHAVRDAFLSVFPPMENYDMLNVISNLKTFISSLDVTDEQLTVVRASATGFFSILKIIGTVIKGVAKVLAVLLSPLKVVAHYLGDFIVYISGILEGIPDKLNGFSGFSSALETLKSFSDGVTAVLEGAGEAFEGFFSIFERSGGFHPIGSIVTFFKSLRDIGSVANEAVRVGILDPLARLNDNLRGAGDAIGTPIVSKAASLVPESVLERFQTDSDSVCESEEKVADASDLAAVALGGVAQNVSTVSDQVSNHATPALDSMSVVFEKVGSVFGKIGEKLAEWRDSFIEMLDRSFETGDFRTLFAFIENILFVVILGKISRFNTRLTKAVGEIAGSFSGMLSQFGGIGKSISGTLTGLGNSLKAFPETVAKGIENGLTSISNGLTGMKSIDPKQIVAIAVAVYILAMALELLKDLNLKQIGIGLAGVAGSMGVMMGALFIFTKFVNANDFKTTLSASGGLKGILKGGGINATSTPFASMALFIAGLAVGIYILSQSLVSLKDLSLQDIGEGLLAIAAIMAMLAGFMILMKKTGALEPSVFSVGSKLKKVSASTTSLMEFVVVAAAIRLMADTILVLANLDPNKLNTAMTAFAGIMLGLTAAMYMIGKAKVSFAAAVTLLALAAVVTAMIIPIQAFGNMETENLIKGATIAGAILLVMAVAVRIIGSATKSFNASWAKNAKNITSSAPSFISAAVVIGALTAAVYIIAEAIGNLAEVDLDQTGQLERAVAALSVVLGVILAFYAVVELLSQRKMKLDGKGSVVSTAGIEMIALAAGVYILAEALGMLAECEVDRLTAATVAIAATIAALAIATYAMKSITAKDILSMGAMITAILPLAAGLAVLASLPVKNLVAAIAAIAAVFLILGIAAYALKPVSEIVLLLAGALALIGGVVLGVTLAFAALFSAFASMAAAVALYGVAMLEFIDQLLERLPELGKSIADSVVAFLQELSRMGEPLKQAIVDLVKIAVDALVESTVYMVEGFLTMLDQTIDLLIQYLPTIADKLIELGKQLITTIREKLGVDAEESGKNIVARMIDKLTEGIPDIVDSAMNFIITFIDSLATTIDERHDELYDAIEHLIDSVKQAIEDFAERFMPDAGSALFNFFAVGAGLLGGGAIGFASLPGLIGGLLGGIPGMFGQSGKDDGAAMANGLEQSKGSVKTASSGMINSALDPVTSAVSQFGSTAQASGNSYAGGFTIQSVKDKVFGNSAAMAGQAKSGAGSVSLYGTGVDTAAGYDDGIVAKFPDVVTHVGNYADKVKNKIKDVLGIKSPSRVMYEYGSFTVQGFANGIRDNASKAELSAQMMAEGTMKAFSEAISTSADMMDGDYQPVITPVVDLTNVRAAGSQVGSIFNRSGVFANLESNVQGIGHSTRISEQLSDGHAVATGGTVINQTFNQTNNSPKALSQFEIYRKTKSLFAAAKNSDTVVVYNA